MLPSPCAVPARSRSLGIAAKTDGVYPFVAGGSPTESPISLCAIANRVNESIISKTFLPRSRKYSAIAVATYAPRIRISGGWSDVATTTTDLFNPSSPRESSINSFSSLPRSPISAITLISAFVFFAIMPSRTDLPTPEPAMMPILCPIPTVNRAFIARIPRSSGSRIRFLTIGFIGSAYRFRSYLHTGAGLPSIGRPVPSITRPSKDSSTRTPADSLLTAIRLPGAIPLISPSGIISTRFPANPTTSAWMGG